MPGDKSISHRAAMIAALAEGTSEIRNFSTSADCAATLSCLQQLGVRLERRGHDILIHGVGFDGLRASGKLLECANSGTTMRLLAGILAAQDFRSVLTGDDSLRSRPMQRIIEPLTMMGASISSNDGRAPLTIGGQRPLAAIAYELLLASAQVKSCILLAGLGADGRTELTEPLAGAGGSRGATRDHTERMLRWFGVPVEERGGPREASHVIAVTGPARFKAHDVAIPGDISSAAYFVAAAALLPDSELEIAEVGVNPTRALFLKHLRALGLDVTVSEAREESNEPVATVRASGQAKPRPRSNFHSTTIQGLIVPQLIDELPLMSVVGSQVEGGIEIRDAAELRLKESDRIATTVQNLRAMGVEVKEFDDGLRVNGPTRLSGAKIDPRGDHRIAMAFAVAALMAEDETEIEDADCVAVSFPEFFDLLESVTEH